MKTLLKNAKLYAQSDLSHVVMNARFGGGMAKNLRVSVSSLSSNAEIIIGAMSVIVYDRMHGLQHYISLLDGSVETKKLGESWA